MNEEKILLYISFVKNQCAKHKWWEKYRPTVHEYRQRGANPFILAYCPVPEYYYKKKKWQRERLSDMLSELIDGIAPDDVILHQQIRSALGMSTASRDLPPEYVLQAMLGRRRRFDSISVCLPPEGGTEVYDVIVTLLAPYLPRTNMLYLIGEEDWLFEELEDYFYFEYGIVVQSGKRPVKGSLCIDLWSEKFASVLADWDSGAITHGETLKFLDTMVKNGYNTES